LFGCGADGEVSVTVPLPLVVADTVVAALVVP
jgi:hypothetical protein